MTTRSNYSKALTDRLWELSTALSQQYTYVYHVRRQYSPFWNEWPWRFNFKLRKTATSLRKQLYCRAGRSRLLAKSRHVSDPSSCSLHRSTTVAKYSIVCPLRPTSASIRGTVRRRQGARRGVARPTWLRVLLTVSPIRTTGNLHFPDRIWIGKLLRQIVAG